MRAIILAAGMGTRLRPVTDETPKSLVKVCGEPMAERQIRFLKEKGIDDIIVVTGYLKDKFGYLEDKYGVKLVHNDKYDVCNNFYTMYLVREYLKDAYVAEADVYMKRNFFDPGIRKSSYFAGYRESFKGEWKVCFDEMMKLTGVKVCSGTGYIMSGISYWSESDGALIAEKLEETFEKGNFENIYWDSVVAENLRQLDIMVRKIEPDDWFEIDSIEDLKEAEKRILCGSSDNYTDN